MYKRYIYKNGKKIGPYYYENKKVDGKVISTYLGTSLPENKKLGKRIKSKNLFTGKYKYIIIGGVVLLLLVTLINFLFLVDLEPTGEASIIVEDQIYDSDQLLRGVVRLNFNKGELIPENTQVIVNNVGDSNLFLLKDLLTDSPTQGNFYITGTSLSGYGLGYGVEGTKQTSSEVSFTMEITRLKDLEEIKQITSQKLPITGEAIIESINEVKATTSAQFPYTYELEPGETAEIIYSSQPVELTIQDNTAIVTTEYSEVKQGFGEDYLVNEKVVFSFDLEQLNLLAKQGELTIDFIYNDETLLSATKTITLGEPMEEVEEEEPPPEEEPLFEKGSSPKFFENCEDISEWTINGNWASGLLCQSGRYDGAKMDSINIDLSDSTIIYANLSFEYDNNGLDSQGQADYLKVYVKNSVSAWIEIFSTNDNVPNTVEINISEYITLDNSVQIRGECRSGNREWCAWDNINITAYLEEINSPPVIDSIGPVASEDPLEGTFRPVIFDVQVSDPDGYTDIISVTAEFNFTGEPTRSNLSCNLQSGSGTTATYECTVNMQYHDAAGDWTVTITVEDSQGASDTNNSEVFTYNLLNALTIFPVAINFGTINLGAINQIPLEHLTVTNTGNYESDVHITAYDLLGEDLVTYFNADEFSVGTSGLECASLNFLANSTLVDTEILASRGPSPLNEAYVYYCVQEVPYLPSQTYSTAQAPSQPWIIEIF